MMTKENCDVSVDAHNGVDPDRKEINTMPVEMIPTPCYDALNAPALFKARYDWPRTEYRCWCPACGKTGPHAKSKCKAIRAWNEMMGDKCEL